MSEWIKKLEDSLGDDSFEDSFDQFVKEKKKPVKSFSSDEIKELSTK